MSQVIVREAFSLGQVVATHSAVEMLKLSDILAAILRHSRCDWGELSEEDQILNDLSVEDEGRLLSVYTDSNGVRFWIITEWDRSVTTVLLPEDY